MLTRSRPWLSVFNLSAVAFISVLDWLTPGGAVVGILLVLPIVLSSLTDDPREVWLTFGAAVGGFLLAAYFGRAPMSPAPIWVPDRILAALGLPTSCTVALLLQRRRRMTDAAREEAVRARDLNRLMTSLLAHDLRSPLAMAVQAFEYIEGCVDRDEPLQASLLSDVRERLRRGLASVDNVLSLAPAEGADRASAAGPALRTSAEIAAELEAEVQAFAAEAAARNSELKVELRSSDERSYRVDMLALRQVLAILVDNAVRHARPGSIMVSGAVGDRLLEVTVEDGGPAPAVGRWSSSGSAGAGLGLQLCRALVSRAGGALTADLGRPDGSTVRVRLPLAGHAGDDRS